MRGRWKGQRWRAGRSWRKGERLEDWLERKKVETGKIAVAASELSRVAGRMLTEGGR
jgi:hypothetical protein